MIDVVQTLKKSTKDIAVVCDCAAQVAEVESSRTPFEVLGLEGQVLGLENWPTLGSRTALFFELLKFCEALEKFFGKRYFVEIAWKIFVKTFFFFFFFWRSPKKFLWRRFFFFFLESTCAWSLALSIPVLGLECVCPRKSCPWLRIFLCPWPRALCSRLHLWQVGQVLIHFSTCLLHNI